MLIRMSLFCSSVRVNMASVIPARPIVPTSREEIWQRNNQVEGLYSYYLRRHYLLG